MPCIPSPKLPIPSLPAGISISVPLPPLPSISLDGACCILPTLQTPKIPIPLPPLVVNPALVATLRAGLAAIEAYEAAIPLDCPRS